MLKDEKWFRDGEKGEIKPETYGQEGQKNQKCNEAWIAILTLLSPIIL
jgi:hypothetical protein